MAVGRFVEIFGTNPVVHALVGGLVIALLNLFGASLVLVVRDPSQRTLDGALGFAAGVMLAASFTSLIIPGIELTEVVVPGIPATGLLLPVEETRVASVVLFILAITLHNMPEGLAVGVGLCSGRIGEAVALMFAIGIQNVPEGFAVSIAAVSAGLDRRLYAVVAGVRAGLVEIPLAVFGAVAAPILPSDSPRRAVRGRPPPAHRAVTETGYCCLLSDANRANANTALGSQWPSPIGSGVGRELLRRGVLPCGESGRSRQVVSFRAAANPTPCSAVIDSRHRLPIRATPGSVYR